LTKTIIRLSFEFQLRLDYGRSPHVYVNQLELLMMSGMALEKC
jgi:hypothetical protein